MGGDARDAHLRGPDFLDAENHPVIAFVSREVQRVGETDFRVSGDLSIRGVTRPVELKARYLGRWQCPYWEGGKDLGPVSRIGFTATATINRHDFGVNWNAPMEKGGVVVGAEVAMTRGLYEGQAIDTRCPRRRTMRACPPALPFRT